MNKTELQKMFPMISKSQIDWEIEHRTRKTDRGFLKYLGGINAEYERKASKPDLVSMTIKIKWYKSSVWGNCPNASYYGEFADGSTCHGTDIRCGGCGYDKESTVVAEIFNREFTGMLWRRRRALTPAPYGCKVKKTWFPHCEGGVGMSCYSAIVAFLGGELKHVAWSDDFDQYQITFKKKRK